MDRREALLGGAALMALAAAQAGAAEHDHAHHHAAGGFGALAAAAADCVQKGQACIDHCLVLLGEGDKAMAACAQTASQMLAVCGALQRLANARSKHLPQMAKLANEVCRECEAECKRHADKHAECRACMESCAACAQECRKLAA